MAEEERDAIVWTFEASGKASTSELSELISEFSCWKKTHRNGESSGNVTASVSPEDMNEDLDKIRDVLRLVDERLKSNDSKVTLNGKDFYYNPEKTEMTDGLRASLEEYSLLKEATEQAYSISNENGELAVY